MNDLFDQILQKSTKFELKAVVSNQNQDLEVEFLKSDCFSNLSEQETSLIYGLMASYLSVDDELTESKQTTLNEEISGTVTLNLNYDSNSGWKLVVEPSETIVDSPARASIISLILTKLEFLEANA